MQTVLSCFSSVGLFATRWIVAPQPPLSMGFSRQEYWSGLPGSPPEWPINNIVKFQVDSKGTRHKYTCSFFFFLLFILIFSCGEGEESIEKNILLYPEVCFKQNLLFHFMTQPKTSRFPQLSSPSRQPFHQDQFEVSMIISFYENHFGHLKKSPSSWANSTP